VALILLLDLQLENWFVQFYIDNQCKIEQGMSHIGMLYAMQRQSLLYFIVVLISVSLTFCEQQSEAERRVINAVVPADFVKEVPISDKGTPNEREDYIYRYTNKEASKLYLDSLETGYDSLQLRIWLGHSLARAKHVVILKYTKNTWT
jgi:hypothetical protein